MVLKKRVWTVIAFFALLYAAVIAKAFYYQVIGDPTLERLCRSQYEKEVVIPPVRGKILDRRGKELAVTTPAFSIGIIPSRVKDRKGVARIASDVLGISYRKALKSLSSKKSFLFLARKVEEETVERFVRELGKLPEFSREYSRFGRIGILSVLPDPKRVYPSGRLASTVLGFCDVDLKGLEGVERAFDEFLAGEEERITCIRDARGRLIVPEGIEKERTEGKTIQLTIDGTVQFICEREIERGVREFGAKSGIAIVMDPRTGEVLAMAVYPSYDPNSPSRYPASWRRNRAITDIYEPGSTFKVFLVAGALDSGKVRLSDKIFCENGVITVQGRRIHDTHENEWLTIPEVLKVSSNIGAYKIAERMTPRLFYSYVKSFGFGRRTGIELKGEVPGLIPDEEEFLKPIRYATASFGQGVAATALQVTSAFCAAVNGGILVKPTVIKEVRSPEGEILYRTRPRYRGRVISSSTSRVLREILAGVVSEEGTGSLARINGYSIGGKTGTSQKVDPVKGGYSDKRIASFIGFFPVDEPRFVVSVVVDEPEEEVYGGKVAAPIFRRIVSKLAIYEGLPPEGGGQQVALTSDEGKEAEIGGRGPKLVRVSFGGPDESSVVMPDLKGLTMVEVVDLLDSLGLEYELKGSGLAAGQFPAPGKRVKRGRTCRVYFREE